ncbi:unnamed protein product, partial [Amoebophrya sp. A25]
ARTGRVLISFGAFVHVVLQDTSFREIPWGNSMKGIP